MSNKAATTIPLKEPIQAHGETVTALVLEAPRAKHLRNLPVKTVLTMGDLLDLAAVCTGLPTSSIDQLCGADALEVVGVIGGFLGGDTGAQPSS